MFFGLLLDQWLLNMVLQSDPAQVMCRVLSPGLLYTSLYTLQFFHRPMKKMTVIELCTPCATQFQSNNTSTVTLRGEGSNGTHFVL